MRLGIEVCKVGIKSKVDRRNELNGKWLGACLGECYYKSKLTV